MDGWWEERGGEGKRGSSWNEREGKERCCARVFLKVSAGGNYGDAWPG